MVYLSIYFPAYQEDINIITSIHWRAVTTPYWYYRFDTLIMGILMFLFYMRTKDIRYCIITHITLNFIVYILYDIAL